MSGNPQKQPVTNNWLSSILRPRASSVTVESCLNISTLDPSTPLDARPILALLEPSQPLLARCKHLSTFAEICKSYKFTHLENVFFTVQDILDPNMAREARHIVFEFMLACIVGQYADLGMARVTFYSSLKSYSNWEDLGDMYRVLFALCKEGRDISGFEKNIVKLLIQWLGVALKPNATTATSTGGPIPYLGDILHLLTVIAKFNFALFEESEVTEMIRATHMAFFKSDHVQDARSCLEFADIVVRYRFVPLDGLADFLDILAASVMILPDSLSPNNKTTTAGVSCWPIFLNLLRSHCAHSAILRLCKFLDKQPSQVDAENILIKGAIHLLSEAAWGENSINNNKNVSTSGISNSRSTGAETYMVSDSVILLYLKRAATKGNDAINGHILQYLVMLLKESPQEKNRLSLMEWDAVWDIIDVFTHYILKITDNNSNSDVKLFDTFACASSTSFCIHQFSKFSQIAIQMYKEKTYKGPLTRLMEMLYKLRAYCCDDTAFILLDYYIMEHSLLPSTENWLPLLKDMANTFYIHANNSITTSRIRLKMLDIVTDICIAVKDFYSEITYESIVIPMISKLPLEVDEQIRQKAIDLLVSLLSDCQNDNIFERLITVLHECARCRCVSEEEQKQQQLYRQQCRQEKNMRMSTTRTHSPQIHRPNTTSMASSSSSTTNSMATIISSNRNKRTIPATAIKSFMLSLESPHPNGSCFGVPAMCGISELFENLLSTSNARFCARTFNVVTDIANDRADLYCPYGGPKIVAIDLLLRLRCPTNHHIYLVKDDIEEKDAVIASIRLKQRKRREENEKKNPTEQFISTSMRPNKQSQEEGQQQRKPKEKAFHPSPNIFSYNENKIDGKTEAALETDEILKSYILVLGHSPNWALVLFILQRLPQQLSNKHLFCGASFSINKLHRRLVKWTTDRRFLENVINLPPHLKRNDLHLYAYNLLTIIISYRRIFIDPKKNQDEIVYAFYVGIMQVTSATRLCINSLAVCCHELPLSVAKMLNEILQRMSQIISVSSVSVHILEFLSGLARLPNLYTNFTGDMYKPVFAIALNYLQHSHSQQEQQRQQQQQPQQQQSYSQQQQSQQQQQQQQISPMTTPSVSPMMSPSGPGTAGYSSSATKEISQDALKQYVLIMAYLVITIWFTAIPLRERRKHVPFIIQRLLSGISMGKSIDEQTYTCIDMLSRFTFADVTLAPEKSIVSKILMGDNSGDSDIAGTATKATIKQSQRTWVYGHTLLTMKTAKSPGWMEVTIRRPSGTVSMMCYVENKIKSEEIDYKTLPALLMMQYQPDLMASKVIKDTKKEEEKGETKKQELQQEAEDQQEVEEGYALGITFNEEKTGIATPTARQPFEQSISNATVATRSDGLVMAPSSSEVTVSRKTSLSQKGLAEILHRDSESNAATATNLVHTSSSISSSIATAIQGNTTINNDTDKAKEEQATAHAAVRELMSEPKSTESHNKKTNTVSQLRRTEPLIDPGFLYLQYNNYPDILRITDISPPLPDDEATARSIATFDRIPVVDFHKIGVLYVAKGQHHELDILANTHGSPDYVRFLNSLGTLQRLRGRNGNTGGLDKEMDIDGKYAYFWKDDVTEAVFHAATLMPTHLDRDPQCNAKKRHIGNDYVSIVYNDSGVDYAFNTLPSQFNFVNIVVSPHSISTEAVSPSHALAGAENTFFKVEMQRRPDMPDIGPLEEPKLVSAQSLPGFVRLMAIHANIFAQVFWQSGAGGKREYVSHWRERLKQIQRIKERLNGKNNMSGASETAGVATSSTAAMGNTSTSTSATAATLTGKMGKDGYPYEALLDFTKYT